MWRGSCPFGRGCNQTTGGSTNVRLGTRMTGELMMRNRRWVFLAVIAIAVSGFGIVSLARPVTQPTGTWELLGSLVEARHGASATMLDDGRVLVAGGDNAGGALASAEIVAADGGSAAAAGMNVARRGHTATKLKD